MLCSIVCPFLNEVSGRVDGEGVGRWGGWSQGSGRGTRGKEGGETAPLYKINFKKMLFN